MARIVLNILGHQTAWWACVLSARADAASIGLGVTVFVVAVHLVASPARRFEAWFIPLAAAVGYSADTLAALLGAMQFPNNPQPALPAPLWIAALWLAFATTIHTSCSWLYHRAGAAAALGAVSGPLAYAAGAALDAVVLPRPLWSVAVLGVLWGAALVILVVIAERGTRPGPSAGRSPRGTVEGVA